MVALKMRALSSVSPMGTDTLLRVCRSTQRLSTGAWCLSPSCQGDRRITRCNLGSNGYPEGRQSPPGVGREGHLVMSLRLQPGLSQEVHQPLMGTYGICVCRLLPTLSMGNPVSIVTKTFHILISARP